MSRQAGRFHGRTKTMSETRYTLQRQFRKGGEFTSLRSGLTLCEALKRFEEAVGRVIQSGGAGSCGSVHSLRVLATTGKVVCVARAEELRSKRVANWKAWCIERQ